MEICYAIGELTKELREVRIALNTITEILRDVSAAGEGTYPGHIRVGNVQL